MICAELVPTESGPQLVAVASVQPADMSTCPAVLVTGAEVLSISSISFPSPADMGTAWGFGFSTVVGSYLIAWSVGAVLNFLQKKG